MESLTVRIPASLRKDLDALSRQLGRPASEIVRDALRRAVAVEKFRTLRRKTLPLAEAQGLLTDEDVFKSIS